jgi:hypothetical protein
LDLILKSNNFSPNAFERGFNRHGFADLSRGSGATLRGIAGEAFVLDELNKAGYAAVSQPTILQGVLPDILYGYPAAEITVKFRLPGVLRRKVGVNTHLDLPNILQDASGTTGTEEFKGIKAFLLEVKTGLSASTIEKGANQTAATALAIKVANIPAVAVLLVDQDAWNSLDSNAQERIYNTVTNAGGYIQVVNGLIDAATQRANKVVEEARRRKPKKPKKPKAPSGRGFQ